MVAFILNFLAFLLHATRALGQVQISPRSVAVLHGGQARFNCSTDTHWAVMGWLVNRRTVITVSAEHGVFSNSDRFTVVNHTTALSTVWELALWNVTRNYTGNVTCDFQNIGSQTAALSVQEGGTVVIDGGNVTSSKGERVLFQCRASDWSPEPQISWALGGKTLSEGANDYTTSSEATADGLLRSTSTLHVLALENTWVECAASLPTLPAPRTDSVFLTVEPGGGDQTALIAAAVSVLAIVLLAPLIIALICCCTRKAKSRNTEDTRDNSQDTEEVIERAGHGQVNLGYSWDGNAGISRSELRGDRDPTDSASPDQQAPQISGSSVYPNDFSAGVAKKVRHATTV